MKNLILGLIGAFITLYTILIGINLLMIQTRQNEMDRQVSRIVRQVLETQYQTGDEEVVKQMLLQEIRSAISKDKNVRIEILAMDLQKGLLSVKVTQEVKLLNGRKRELVVEKTAIIERATWKPHI